MGLGTGSCNFMAGNSNWTIAKTYSRPMALGRFPIVLSSAPATPDTSPYHITWIDPSTWLRINDETLPEADLNVFTI